MSKSTTYNLPAIANEVRKDILKLVHAAGSGHPGGAMGIADILVYLYFKHLNVDPANPAKEDRDKFVLSPAHQVPGLYAVLAARGFFAKSELKTSRQFGSLLQGHAFRNLDIGVETTGGSLGQGFSVACGFALESRFRRENIGSIAKPPFRTYCIVSDGELNEGQTWEAIMFAAKERLNELVVILDNNGIQLSDDTKNIMPLEPVNRKFEAFGWNVLEIDGHDYEQIAFALGKTTLVQHKPTIIIANTIPGKGVSFMENKWQWHGKAPNDEELAQGLAELDQLDKDL